MAFRLLRYSIAAMHRHLKQGHKRLPMIVPILFYHGKQSPYPYSMRWLDCFDDPAAARHLYTQAFPLVDVTVIPDDEIKTHRKVALLEYVQKHIHERDINIHLNIIAWLINKFKLSRDLVVCFLHYLTQKGNALDLKDLIRILEQNTPHYREEMMTLAEHLKKEGRLEGRSEQAKEIARNLLSMGLDRDAIIRATGMTCSEIDALPDAEM